MPVNGFPSGADLGFGDGLAFGLGFGCTTGAGLPEQLETPKYVPTPIAASPVTAASPLLRVNDMPPNVRLPLGSGRASFAIRIIVARNAYAA
jgi:hypothetical protein